MRIAIETYLKGITDALIADQRNKGLRASGRSADSLRSEITDDGGKLFGADYFKDQVHGKPPGEWPNIDDIIEWIQNKRLQYDIPIKSLAFLISRKIYNFGTNIHMGAGVNSEGLALHEIAKQGLPQLMKAIARDKALQITTPIRRRQTETA